MGQVVSLSQHQATKTMQIREAEKRAKEALDTAPSLRTLQRYSARTVKNPRERSALPAHNGTYGRVDGEVQPPILPDMRYQTPLMFASGRV